MYSIVLYPVFYKYTIIRLKPAKYQINKLSRLVHCIFAIKLDFFMKQKAVKSFFMTQYFYPLLIPLFSIKYNKSFSVTT